MSNEFVTLLSQFFLSSLYYVENWPNLTYSPFFLPRLLIFLILVLQTLWSKLFIVERCYQVPLPEISKDLSYCGKDILHWKFGNMKLLISDLYYCIDFNFWKRHLFSCHWALFYGNFMMHKKWQSNPLYERLAVTLGWHETIKK